MMHKGRVWQLPHVAGIEWLAAELSQDGCTYTPCSAFRIKGTDLVLLTGPNGAQEFAVILGADLDTELASGGKHGWQVESLTCSWMTRDGLRAALAEYAEIARQSDALARFQDRLFANKVAWATHPKDESCRWCA